MTTVKRDASGKVAWMRQTLEMKENSGSVDGDNNGFVNIPLTAKEVEAVIYMREVEPNVFRVSLRSKGKINVARIAEKFDGGGHKNAAGCRAHRRLGNNRNLKLFPQLSKPVERLPIKNSKTD